MVLFFGPTSTSSSGSLVPFVTAWAGDHPSILPVATYGAGDPRRLRLLPSVRFLPTARDSVLAVAIGTHQGRPWDRCPGHPPLHGEHGRRMGPIPGRRGYLAVPDRRIERAITPSVLPCTVLIAVQQLPLALF
jgi:hypothetical protein